MGFKFMRLKIFVLHMNMIILYEKKPTADYGRKRAARQIDSSHSLLNGFSTYLDFRRPRFKH